MSCHSVSDNAPAFIADAAREDVGYMIGSQLRQAELKRPPSADVARGEADATFQSEEQVWRKIIGQTLRPGQIVVLEDFELLEWIPRSPGLYFTERAAQSRHMAEQYVQFVPKGESETEFAIGAEGGQVKVFNPYGKLAMLNGGIGALRLKPRTLGTREVCFITASSSGSAHKGIPLAVPEDLYYGKCGGEIQERGACRRTVVGRLKFLAGDLATIYRGYTGVPQLYLAVEDLLPSPRREIDPKVSVAISFSSAYEGRFQVYASYVFFSPAREGSFDRNVRWMEQVYVKAQHRGEILTDFDEQRNTFENATFSLNKVMNGRLDEQQARTVIANLHLYGGEVTAAHIETVNRIQNVRVDGTRVEGDLRISND